MVYEANYYHAQPIRKRLTELDSSEEKGWTVQKKTTLCSKEGDIFAFAKSRTVVHIPVFLRSLTL